jgi:hypothetical protein
MSVTSSFSQQQQFHLLVDIRGADHHMAVLPGGNGRFLVIDKGKILGEIRFDEQFNCTSNRTNLSNIGMVQLNAGIKNHCWYRHL